MQRSTCYNAAMITGRRLLISLAFATVIGFAAAPVYARVGVGMGAGEIRLTEGIKPGGMYQLPNVRIFNTGDETATYGMGIAYHQDRPEMRPGKDWFSFNPATFTLEPGKSQDVFVTMMVPLKIEPGDYFAFIESGPVPTDAPGTSVGVAVATKLFFTAVPANIFQAAQYRVSSFFAAYSPYSWITLGILIFIAVLLLLRRFVSFNISVRKS
jgi:hypothetical protein